MLKTNGFFPQIIKYHFILSLIYFSNCLFSAENKIPNLSVLIASQQSIEIDGVLDEQIWKNAIKVPLSYEIEPAENQNAKVDTQAYLFEDSEYLYIAFDAKDPNPNSIRAYLSPRDKLTQSDYVQV
ncbi:MAG: hydrolase, partial [Kangiellaceae bacterium]